MNVEVKALSAYIEATDAGIVTGIASAPATDRDGDSIDPAAFVFDLPLPMLFNHDAGEVVGRWTKVEATGDGLLVEGKLNLDTARGQDVYALLRTGDLRGLSVGFKTTAASSTATGRRITAADLLEISLVAVPANPAARILTVKGSNMTDVSVIESRLEALELAAARPAIAPAPAFDEPTVERKAFVNYLRIGREHMDLDETKALVSGTTNGLTGGFLVPEQFERELIKNLVEHSPIRQIARISQASGDEVTLPLRTAGSTATWTDEWDTTTPGPEPRTPSQPTYSQKKLQVHELATYVEVTRRLLEDSAFNLESELALDLAEAFGKAEGVAFVKGSGTGQPAGFLTDTTLTTGALVTAASNVVTADEIISLAYSLPSAYRAKGVFVANRTTIATIRKIKDGTANYIWQPGLQAGQPETLLGYPLVEAPDMDDIGAGKYPLAFGDFQSGFRIFDRVALSVLRDDYSAAVNGVVRFHARRRVAAGVVKAEALKLLKVKA
ncbi:phage major capsid protein [Pseudochelatococcus lubricantis]|uniref:phage major capsid protein n=1 Tax=Pseudochelatococcus lubricantis TaxID=1538102 RepID=UPI0035EB6F01